MLNINILKMKKNLNYKTIDENDNVVWEFADGKTINENDQAVLKFAYTNITKAVCDFAPNTMKKFLMGTTLALSMTKEDFNEYLKELIRMSPAFSWCIIAGGGIPVVNVEKYDFNKDKGIYDILIDVCRIG